MPFPAFFLLAAALGGREALISRRDKADRLDSEADRQAAINAIDLGIDHQSIANNFDQQQVEAMQKQFATAQGMLRSQDPTLQSLGANMLADLDSAVRGNIQQNENEARADVVRIQDQEIAAAGVGKAANEKRFERELVMNRQLNTELKVFETAQLAYNKVNNLLDNNDQLASLAGLTAFVQAIDNSVVREGELLKYQGANGLITQIVNAVNKTEGRDFDEVTKQSIRNATAALLNSEKTRAIAITNSFQDRAVSFGLSPERVLSGVDENLFTPMVITQDAQIRREAQADQAETLQDRIVPFTEDPDKTLGAGFGVLVDKALQTWQDAGRSLRGATLHIDPTTGAIWEKDAQGIWSKIKGTADMRRQAELLRLESDTVQLTPELQERIAAERSQRIKEVADRLLSGNEAR